MRHRVYYLVRSTAGTVRCLLKFQLYPHQIIITSPPLKELSKTNIHETAHHKSPGTHAEDILHLREYGTDGTKTIIRTRVSGAFSTKYLGAMYVDCDILEDVHVFRKTAGVTHEIPPEFGRHITIHSFAGSATDIQRVFAEPPETRLKRYPFVTPLPNGFSLNPAMRGGRYLEIVFADDSDYTIGLLVYAVNVTDLLDRSHQSDASLPPRHLTFVAFGSGGHRSVKKS